MTPKRIQRRRIKGWRLPPNTVCVTRPGVFGNPWLLTDPVLPGDRKRIVELFRRWLTANEYPAAMPRASVAVLDGRRLQLLTRLPGLRGKDLACFCPVDAKHCHADVLLELANADQARAG